jgi:hypothetical protein
MAAPSIPTNRGAPATLEARRTVTRRPHRGKRIFENGDLFDYRHRVANRDFRQEIA